MAVWDRVDRETIDVHMAARSVRVTGWRYDQNGRGNPATLDSYHAIDLDTDTDVELTSDEDDLVDAAIRAFVERENH
jgi:stalled ribosome rescue protein Dom34